MLDLIAKGGVLMWPIVTCSVIALAIVADRLIFIWVARRNLTAVCSAATSAVLGGDCEAALDLCQERPGAASTVLVQVIAALPAGRVHAEGVASRLGSRVLRELEHRLRALATIANMAPLLGLLGTVTGMIRAFMKIQELHGRVDASVLGGGIGEALITTAAGLIVAIPSLVAYYYFEGQVDDVATEIQQASSQIIETLGGPQA